MMRVKKVCQINNLYKPFNKGGAERIAEIISDGLKKNGIESFVIATRPFFKKKVGEDNVYYLKSLYHSNNKMPSAFKLLLYCFSYLNVLRAFSIAKIIQKEKPDVLITHNLVGIGFLFLLFVRNKSLSHIHILHDIQILHPSGLMFTGKEKIIDGSAAKIYQTFNKFIFKKVNKVISPSDWLLELHKSKGFFGECESRVVPNPVESISLDPKKVLHNKEFTNLIFVGQQEVHKGIFLLLNAFSSISRKNPNLHLTIIGPSNIATKIDKYILDKSIHNVKMFKQLRHNEVCNMLSQSDILVMPSLCYENSTTVIYEAGILGIPSVVSDAGGAVELLNYFPGVSFKSGSKMALIEAIEICINKKYQTPKVDTSVFSPKYYLQNILIK